MADTEEVVRMAALAAGAGGVSRIVMALHGGERRVVVLAIEAALGATLGVMAAAASVWWDPTLRDTGWPLLMVAGAAGMAGAMGTRLMDLIIEAMKKRLV